MKYLRIEEVISYQDFLIKKDGGFGGIRDFGLLSSALAIPSQSFSGQEMHHTVIEKASAYLYHLIKNHPFFDGNKRTAVFCFLVFFDENNVEISFDEDFLYSITLDVAGNKLHKTELISLMNQYFQTNCDKSLSTSS
ncbi:MAG: type II toxin-antitoxin system death-on-curing family toxin [Pseudomonadota bacterium]